MRADVTVEVPKGDRNKYELDHHSGRIRLDRTLFPATHYPGDYGFFEDTLAEDGDPLDVLVLLAEPTFPGCLICVRPVAVFQMSDENGPDAKVLAVPATDPRWEHVVDLPDLDPYLLDEIRHFFTVYKALEPGKGIDVGGWRGRAAAEDELDRAQRRAQAPPTSHAAPAPTDHADRIDRPGGPASPVEDQLL